MRCTPLISLFVFCAFACDLTTGAEVRELVQSEIGDAAEEQSASATASKIKSKLAARQSTLQNSNAFLQTQMDPPHDVHPELGCSKSCASKCASSTSCKDDSCNHDSKSCKNNDYCSWKKGKSKCEGTVPTFAPTLSPSSSPTTAAPTYIICDNTVADNIATVLLPNLVNLFNQEFSDLMINSNLDPWDNAYSTTLDVPKAYFCDEACLGVASTCEKSYLNIDIKEIDGLSNLLISDVDIDSMTVTDDASSCSVLENSSCTYSLDIPVVAYLAEDSKISVTFQDLDFENKCKGWIGGYVTWMTPVHLETMTCKSEDATVKGTMTACISACGNGIDSVGGAIMSAKITEFKINSHTSFTCSASGSFFNDAYAWIISQIAPDLYSVLNPPIEKAINGELKTLVDDLPASTC